MTLQEPDAMRCEPARRPWAVAWALPAALCAASVMGATATPPPKQVAATPLSSSQDIKVAEDDDDAEEAADGDLSLSSSDLEMAYDEERDPHGNQTVGIRFAGVKVPRGGAVRNAYIQFTCKDASEGPCRLTIRGQAAPNAPAFTDKRKNISSRPTTRAEVRWSPPPWKEGAEGAAERTGDLSPIVQEIITAQGWAPGNSLVFIITGPGHDMRRAWSHDGDPKGAPRLHVEWGPGGGARPVPESPTAKQAPGGVASAAPAAQPDQAQRPGWSLGDVVRAATGWLPPAPTSSQDLPLARDEDDAEERADGSVSLSSSDLELVFDEDHDEGNQTVGIRFAGVNVPAGAAVSNSYIQFTCKDSSDEPCHLAIRGEAARSAAPFEEGRRNISARPRTTAEVRWDPPPWKEGKGSEAERTPDLSPVLQEIVGGQGWASGNAIAFIFTGPGKGCRRAYSRDGDNDHAPRLHVEWRPAASGGSGAQATPQGKAAGAPPSPASSLPATAPKAEAPQPGWSLGETVNELIDNLLATGSRLMELPLLMLLAAIGVLAAGVALLLHRLCRKSAHWRLYYSLLAALAVLVLLTGACVVDRKIALLQDEVHRLHSRVNSDTAALLEAARKQSATRRALLVEPAAAEAALEKQFGGIRIQTLVYDEATDVVQLRLTEAVAQVWLVIADLQHAGLEIKLDTDTRSKRLTSQFARENDCAVAINGEAGRSSDRDSGLGEWKGNLVCRGQVILRERPDEPHPFLAFDRQNHATYVPGAARERTLPATAYNAIWGRYDALLDGVVVVKDEGSRQPHTAMAINQAGTRLYLLVVDGRQSGYSRGLGRRDVAGVLKAFGAHHGMLCDEGGSSCIYLKRFGGIANIPCDDEGRERPTYTHFGLSLPGGN